MSWSDAFSNLPPIIRGGAAVFIVVLTVSVVSYTSLVVAPTVPTIVEAVKQGRSFTLVPLAIGEYEPPSVKKCKLIVENTNDSMHSLQNMFDKSVNLLISQQSILQNAMNKRSNYIQLQKTNGMSSSILEQLNEDVQFQDNTVNSTVNQLRNRVKSVIDYLNRIKDYCITLDQP